jgi:hypothetical protein
MEEEEEEEQEEKEQEEKEETGKFTPTHLSKAGIDKPTFACSCTVIEQRHRPRHR